MGCGGAGEDGTRLRRFSHGARMDRTRGHRREALVRCGLGSREIEGRRLIELKFGLGMAPSGGDPGGPMWEVEMEEVEMEEDALHGGGQGDERDDPPLSTGPRCARCPGASGGHPGRPVTNRSRDCT